MTAFSFSLYSEHLLPVCKTDTIFPWRHYEDENMQVHITGGFLQQVSAGEKSFVHYLFIQFTAQLITLN